MVSLHRQARFQHAWHLDSLEHVLSAGDGDVGSLVLDESLANDAALDDKRVSLGAVAAEQASSVKVLADGLGEGASVVGEEVDVRGAAAAELLLPGVNSELVVDGNDEDVLDALGLELGRALDVAWHLRRARTVNQRKPDGEK